MVDLASALAQVEVVFVDFDDFRTTQRGVFQVHPTGNTLELPRGEKGDTGDNGRGVFRLEIVDGRLHVIYTDGDDSDAGVIPVRGISSFTVTGSNMYVNMQDGSQVGPYALPSTPVATLTDGTVTTPKIVDSAVTTAKLATNSVTSAKIADAAVGSNELADGVITGTKMSANAIATNHINNGAVTAAKIANGVLLTPTQRTAWIANGTVYNFGDVVLYKLVRYMCRTAHSSAAAFSTDSANWVALSYYNAAMVAIRTTNQLVPTDQWIGLTTNFQSGDTGEFTNNTGAIYAKSPGWYMVHGNLQWDGVDPINNLRVCAIWKNSGSEKYEGTTVVGRGQYGWSGGASASSMAASATALVYLNGTTDYVQCVQWQNNGQDRLLYAKDSCLRITIQFLHP